MSRFATKQDRAEAHRDVVVLEECLGTRDSNSASRLQDRARLSEHVLYGRTDLGIVYQHHALAVLLAQPERLLQSHARVNCW